MQAAPWRGFRWQDTSYKTKLPAIMIAAALGLGGAMGTAAYLQARSAGVEAAKEKLGVIVENRREEMQLYLASIECNSTSPRSRRTCA